MELEVYLTIQKQLHFQGQLPVDCCCEGTVTWHNIKPPLQPSTGACLFSAILVFLTSQPTLGALHWSELPLVRQIANWSNNLPIGPSSPNPSTNPNRNGRLEHWEKYWTNGQFIGLMGSSQLLLPVVHSGNRVTFQDVSIKSHLISTGLISVSFTFHFTYRCSGVVCHGSHQGDVCWWPGAVSSAHSDQVGLTLRCGLCC